MTIVVHTTRIILTLLYRSLSRLTINPGTLTVQIIIISRKPEIRRCHGWFNFSPALDYAPNSKNCRAIQEPISLHFTTT